MVLNFHLYKISPAFFSITDWSKEKIHIKDNRPNLILTIENKEYPDCVFCIPISKDDDKSNKYKKILQKHPDNVHPLSFNQYDSYALIQNFFALRKEFIGDPFTVNSIHVSIPDNNIQKQIQKKCNKFLALYKAKKPVHIQVDINKVLNTQLEALEQKNISV